MPSDPALFSAAELLRCYRIKQLSPVETTRAVLARIERFDPEVNAFCLVDEERAMAAARASETRWQRGEPCGVVDGVPATIKDLVLSRGWPTLRGSLAIARDQPWDEDAPATARLLWKAVTDCALTRDHPQPLGHEPDAGRLERRRRGRGGARHGRAARRLRRRRLNPHPGRLHRHFRPEAEPLAGCRPILRAPSARSLTSAR